MKRPRTILITGVGSGIGTALATEMLGQGNLVIGLSRNRSALKRLATLAKKMDRRGAFFRCDLRDHAQTLRCVRKAVSTHGPVDILVNNAGVTTFQSLLKTSLATFDEILDVNLRAAFLVTQAVLPGMIRRKSGMIVNIVSYAAKTTYTGSSAYSASKAGLTALMNVLREEVRSSSVKVLNVFPGAVATPMWKMKHRRRFGKIMIPAPYVASLITSLVDQPDRLTVEEIVVRPPVGDLTV